MEFIERNFLVTTTMFIVDSNSTVVSNIFNYDERFQYTSDNFADDLTSTTMKINFNTTTTVSRIAMVEHNLKDFSIYHGDTTTNLFVMSTTAATGTTSFTSNSESAHYFITDAVDVTSLSIKMNSTIEADAEKAIGVLVVSTQKLNFDRIPSANNYKPKRVPKQVVHKMSDGGTRRHRTGDKWDIEIKFTDITTSFRDSLKTIYDTNDSVVFVPFGTSTGWDRIIADSNWTNSFEFFRFAENSTTFGFKGKIKLSERTQ